jgi:hypothetical protein
VKLKLAVCASDKCALCLVNQLLHALFSCLSSSSCDIREIRKFIAKPSSMHKGWLFQYLIESWLFSSRFSIGY